MKITTSNILIGLCALLFASCCNPNRHGVDSHQAFAEYLRYSPVSQANKGIDFTSRANTIRRINERHPGSYVSIHLSRVEDWCRRTPAIDARANAEAAAARESARQGQDLAIEAGQQIGKFASDSPRNTLSNEIDGGIGALFGWVISESFANSQASKANNAIIGPHVDEYRSFLATEAFLCEEHCFPVSEHLRWQLSQSNQN